VGANIGAMIASTVLTIVVTWLWEKAKSI
jgi:hypothetical protein